MTDATLSQAGAGTADASLYLDLYRRMLLIRGFEDCVQSLFLKGHVHGTTHLCSGQEAVEVGVASVLRDGDRAAGTYRGHGHALALGLEPQKLLDELLGRATGVCGGRAGSMNVVDLEHGLIGCFGIVGGSIAAATGAALAFRGSGRVAVAFFGDGAVNQAYFYECLNFAQVFSLPVFFVCENNVYGEYTRSELVTAGTVQGRVETMEIPAQTIDGNDVWAVRAAAGSALEAVRAGRGPAFVQALTYRFVGHSRSDPGAYRPEGELDSWRERDPLTVTRARLAGEWGVAAETLDAVEADVAAELEAVQEAALAAPFPDPAAPVREFKEAAA
jgi:TPP-dependent pyruvate/acetoin dehydrogenase alpha subunit